MSKTVLITGATAGFGAAAARLFVKQGWKAVVTGRRADRLAQLVTELGADKVHPAAFDIRDEAAMTAALLDLPSEFSDIDVLINNAGLALGVKPAPDIDLADWRTMIDTNVTALAVITQHLLPKLIKQRGMIINLSSTASRWPYPGGNCYGGTKAFVRQFSYGLRCDLHGTGVRVTSIEPGLCESEFTLVRTKGDKEAYDQTYKGAHALQPEDIAETLFWVASQPPHVNINSLELMPVSQTWNSFRIYRD
ncbi:MAG: SDR family NAD(P)-dependent oxidoreductase [Zymomonas mobilis subsp. pomaceae]|uniref:Short-chain dehydrogenase/reductase SDR n=1 Tax=Zymomonas mobilis subsp. pomaceae (strain ATCC 29192 / DSM 22645 / JCM 10191 / CCUG 17912 / NBRC 13757 / NCIMB 11200 / NRRL B-4491 / Barker I) TaxID=579138 RepID=F8ESR7_ZYMMT|nr:SDR family NAD(P)-dependent oxidoreductase [Zymomonas mobilis]AEI37842.1 short-chain dehydrogenase/reductase SDR [Zymomonas mobilis subsp. pomaceae ATCC 29192]MDX5949209.1 SDR family NAD(P)-dependent oxidoreductase [Zymomonas mobilis subsp. pomaceae]GEB89563.1 serine 3-dehydrogenase [Zymomonas mobilis subsp. pomaceae]